MRLCQMVSWYATGGCWKAVTVLLDTGSCRLFKLNALKAVAPFPLVYQHEIDVLTW